MNKKKKKSKMNLSEYLYKEWKETIDDKKTIFFNSNESMQRNECRKTKEDTAKDIYQDIESNIFCTWFNLMEDQGKNRTHKRKVKGSTKEKIMLAENVHGFVGNRSVQFLVNFIEEKHDTTNIKKGKGHRQISRQTDKHTKKRGKIART